MSHEVTKPPPASKMGYVTLALSPIPIFLIGMQIFRQDSRITPAFLVICLAYALAVSMVGAIGIARVSGCSNVTIVIGGLIGGMAFFLLNIVIGVLAGCASVGGVKFPSHG